MTCHVCTQEHVQQATFDDKQASEQVFYAYVAESYGFFLAGEDDKCQAVDDRVNNEFADKAEAIKEHTALAQEVR